MVCKFCGNEIEENAAFCFVCGQKISAADVQEESTQPEPPANPPQPEPETLPVAEPASPEEYADVDPVDVQKAGRFTRFVCFVCPLIGALIYLIRAKRGQTGKKRSVANATMSGVCFYLIAAIVFVVMKSMF